MKVINENIKDPTVALETIEGGQAFIYDATEYVRLISDSRCIQGANLETGQARSFQPKDRVIPVDSEVHIHERQI